MFKPACRWAAASETSSSWRRSSPFTCAPGWRGHRRGWPSQRQDRTEAPVHRRACRIQAHGGELMGRRGAEETLLCVGWMRCTLNRGVHEGRPDQAPRSPDQPDVTRPSSSRRPQDLPPVFQEWHGHLKDDQRRGPRKLARRRASRTLWKSTMFTDVPTNSTTRMQYCVLIRRPRVRRTPHAPPTLQSTDTPLPSSYPLYDDPRGGPPIRT